MQLPEDCRLTYVIAHEAWWGKVPTVIGGPRLFVTAAHDGGGAAWEFIVEDVQLGHPKPSIRLGIFDETFVAFQQIPEFFTALGERKPKTLADVVDILDELGAADETERQRPARV